MRAKRQYSTEELDLISNVNLSSQEVADKLGTSACTVYRKRKELGVKNKSGPKPSRNPGAWKKPRETRTCAAPGCDNTFTVIETSSRKLCSRGCVFKIANPAQSGKPRKQRNPNLNEYIRYRNKVHALSQKVYELHKDIINPHNYPRTLNGVEGGYQLDHITTIKESFDAGIPPENVAVLSNLRMLPWKENVQRNTKK